MCRASVSCPPPSARIAYLDLDVPVNDSGTRALLKPMVFGKLLQAAEIGERDRVLDVGCATGYSAAVLAKLGGQRRRTGRGQRARRMRQTARSARRWSAVRSPKGWAQGAPYDVILLEGACEEVPEALFAQLKDGGRLLAVVGAGPMGKATMYRKASGHVSAQPLFDAAAPLLPGFAKAPAFVF